MGKIGRCTVLHIREEVAKVMELTKLAMESKLFFQSMICSGYLFCTGW